jgi:hypothetical protein
LVDLSLLGKQLHRSVVGPRLRPLHLQLDGLSMIRAQRTSPCESNQLPQAAASAPCARSRRCRVRP